LLIVIVIKTETENKSGNSRLKMTTKISHTEEKTNGNRCEIMKL